MYYIWRIETKYMKQKIKVRRKAGELLDSMISCRIKPSVKKRLDKHCEKQEITKSSFINDLLENNLPEKVS